MPPSIREITALDLEHIDTLSAKVDELSFRLLEAVAVSADPRRLTPAPRQGPHSANLRRELCRMF